MRNTPLFTALTWHPKTVCVREPCIWTRINIRIRSNGQGIDGTVIEKTRGIVCAVFSEGRKVFDSRPMLYMALKNTTDKTFISNVSWHPGSLSQNVIVHRENKIWDDLYNIPCLLCWHVVLRDLLDGFPIPTLGRVLPMLRRLWDSKNQSEKYLSSAIWISYKQEIWKIQEIDRLRV
jgi:hypothetical protein